MFNLNPAARFIAAMTITWLVGATMLYVVKGQQDETNTQIKLLNSQNLEINRSLDQLLQRHSRTIRRVREAITIESDFERDSVFAWAADGYPRTMEAGQADLSAALQKAQANSPSEQLTLDLDRLALQFDRLQDLGDKVATALTTLVPTQQLEQAPLWSETTANFHRNESAWLIAHQTAKATLTRAYAREQLRLTTPEKQSIPYWAWALLLLPWLLWWSVNPIKGLARLAETGIAAPSPSTQIEKQLANLLTTLKAEVSQLQDKNTELTTELARASATNRRQERDSALLKLYTDNLVDNLRSSITVTDPGGSITSFNLRARQLLQLNEESRGLDISITTLYASLQESTADADQTLKTILENGQPAHFEGITIQGGEREILLDLRVVPYLDESGSPRGLLWVADDITESVQMKNQLIATEHMATVGRISAQVAHEIRNPLSAIGLNAELLDEEFMLGLEGQSQTEARQLLSAIAREIERLNEITEGYLQLARMPRPKIQSCDLNTLVTDFIAMSRPEFKNKQIDIHLRLATESPLTQSDPGQVRQALLNVVRNSMEAMPEGGNIIVETTLEASLCTIVITDDGPGIPQEEIHRVFEPFYSTKSSGTGLGLSLTQQILTDHGGSIQVEVHSPRGTRVSLLLPRLTDGPNEQKSTSETAA